MSPWFQIALAVLPVILPPLISFSALMYQRQLQRLPDNQRTRVEQIVRIVVPAIEQTANNIMTSPAKKQAAMDLATSMLNSLNIHVQPDTLSAMIEATVYAMNQSKNASTVVTQPSPLANGSPS
jgi:hypothetical protein